MRILSRMALIEKWCDFLLKHSYMINQEQRDSLILMKGENNTKLLANRIEEITDTNKYTTFHCIECNNDIEDDYIIEIGDKYGKSGFICFSCFNQMNRDLDKFIGEDKNE